MGERTGENLVLLDRDLWACATSMIFSPMLPLPLATTCGAPDLS